MTVRLTIEKGHTLTEYMQKYGKDYENGDLWDFSENDLTNGAIEPDTSMVYWEITLDGTTRYFETYQKGGYKSIDLYNDLYLFSDFLRF